MKKTAEITGIIFVTILLAGFAFLSIRGLMDPQTGSGRFGMPVSDTAGALFYSVYLSRNLVIVITGLILLALRYWTPLAILTTVAIGLPLFDTLILIRDLGNAAPLNFHIIALCFITVTSVLIWIKALNARS